MEQVSTEDKIKEAARQLFLKKGYKATRSRDIAEAAGINLALLNYYYRSKEKLFDIIMLESVQEMFASIIHVVNDESTDIYEKIDLVVNGYMDMILNNPHLPLFVLSEIQANPEKFIEKGSIPKEFMTKSAFFRQIVEKLSPDINPLHIFINVVSMSIFPVVGKPLLRTINYLDEDEYTAFVNERRILIPMWIKAMLDSHNK